MRKCKTILIKRIFAEFSPVGLFMCLDFSLGYCGAPTSRLLPTKLKPSSTGNPKCRILTSSEAELPLADDFATNDTKAMRVIVQAEKLAQWTVKTSTSPLSTPFPPSKCWKKGNEWFTYFEVESLCPFDVFHIR